MAQQVNEGVLRLGTRGSALARWQAEWVASQLQAHEIPVQLELIKTEGDISRQPITEIGGQGLFTKEIQRALLARRIDLAVHSLKDLPTEPVPGLTLTAVPPRGSHRDVLVSREHQPLDQLAAGARIGTGSRRRQAQLLHQRPDLRLLVIRGNVDTRLQKLDGGEYDAIILAEAGLQRLGLTDRISQVLPEEVMLPAIGQGALGVECRSDDAATRTAVTCLDQPETHASVLAERALLATLRGGCLAPIAGWARMVDRHLQLEAVVLSADGRRRLTASGQRRLQEAHELGVAVAQQLLEQGAAELIAECR